MFGCWAYIELGLHTLFAYGVSATIRDFIFKPLHVNQSLIKNTKQQACSLWCFVPCDRAVV